MTKVMAWIHGWVGAFFGLLFGFVMITGAVLLVEDMVHQQELVSSAPAIQIDKSKEQIAKDIDAAIAVAEFELGFTPTGIRPPLEHIPVFRVQTDRNNRHYLAADDLSVVETHGSLLETPGIHQSLNLIRDWHVSIVNGTSYTGWIGLIGSFLGILGLVIFWPWRRTFNWRNWGWPKDWGRAGLMSNHLTAGTISLVFLLLFGLSGFYLDFRGAVNGWIADYSGQELSEEAEAADTAESELVRIETAPVPLLAAAQPVNNLMAAGGGTVDMAAANEGGRAGRQAEVVVVEAGRAGRQVDAAAPVEPVMAQGGSGGRRGGGGGITAAQLAALGEPIPASELALLAYQVAPGHVISDMSGFGGLTRTFRMRPEEGAIDPMGRTYVTLNAFTGEPTNVEIGEERHWMLKTVQLSGPLHMGREMSQVYKAVATLGSFLVGIICFTGFVSFVRKKLAEQVAKQTA